MYTCEVHVHTCTYLLRDLQFTPIGFFRVFFLLLTDNYFIDDYARFSTLDTKEKNTAVANSMNYMTKKGKTEGGGLIDFWFENQTLLFISTENNLVPFKCKIFLRVFSLCPPPPPPHVIYKCPCIRDDHHQQAW